MADTTKKLVLLMSESINNNTRRNGFEGDDINKIFEAYTKIKGSDILYDRGQEGDQNTPNVIYIEVSQSLFEYIKNKMIMENGVTSFESKININMEKGITVVCCPYLGFITYVEEFINKLKERQQVTVNILNELGDELIFVTNLKKSICDPIANLYNNIDKNTTEYCFQENEPKY